MNIDHTGMLRSEFERLQFERPTYPVPSARVVAELEQRGYAATPKTLERAIAGGIVDPPKSTRNHQWRAEDVDAVASWLESREEWTDLAVACRVFGVSLGDYHAAALEAQLHGEIDAGYEVVFHAGKVEFRPRRGDEVADRVEVDE